jgi:predicted Kef-type K+ transport protein
VKLFATALRDLPMLAGKAIKVSMHSTYLTIAGFALGLFCAFVPGFFVNSFYSPTGSIFGAVLILIGVGLHLAGDGNAKKPE